MAWFDAHASDYDAWYDTELGRYVDSVEKGLIEELAQPVAGERALDIGCGTGNHAIWLAEKGLVITGLDESPAMLEVASAKTGGTGLAVDWVLGDASALPFEEPCSDLVIAVAAVEFVDDRDAVLRDAMRVLRPGGRLVLGLLTRDSPWGEFYLRDVEERPGSVFAKASFFTEDELPGMIACQMSLYPLGAGDFNALISDAVESLEPLEGRGLRVEVGSMSTVVTGPDDLVWEAARLLFDTAAENGQRIVLTATLSDECGCDVQPRDC